ncbi:hypothetical protein AAFC00_007185 [Neodothiora populina]|uniref:Autophagy protein n=1 Tax=Neodothiora populina TaxID=2781224 RepID=A0ABR3PHG0_9PEZI
MGWFWGSTDNQGASTSSKDAYNDLDPSLRDFLEKESPYRHQPAPKPAQQQQQQQESQSYRSQLGITKPDESATTPPASSTPASSDSKAAVPQESLFKDGRYAHLWKTYTPMSEIEASSRTDQDRLTDVVEAYNERKAQIGRAAVENCVFEQIAEHECFKKGGVQARLTMCSEQNKAFNRCYTMQSRFLKALGYLSMERSEAEEERIQMHADSLYQEMIAREKAAAKAIDEGLPVPKFEPLINNAAATDVSASENKGKGLDMYTAERRKEIEASLAGKSPDERELDIQLLVAEQNASREYAEKIQEYFQDEKKLRADRKERGRETFGDSIKRIWGWDR